MTQGKLGLKSPKIRNPDIGIRNKFEIQKLKKTNKEKTSEKHLLFGWSFKPFFLLPGQESRRRSQKGPGETSPLLRSSFPQRDAMRT